MDLSTRVLEHFAQGSLQGSLKGLNARGGYLQDLLLLHQWFTELLSTGD